MTNREKYLDIILSLAEWGISKSVIVECGSCDCAECDFDSFTAGDCAAARLAWLKSEVDEESEIDWRRWLWIHRW